MFRQAPSFPYHDLGIVEDGNTASRAISKDAYVIWKGSSYFASTDILQGATLEEDVNLTAIPDGVINGVVSALNNNFICNKLGEKAVANQAATTIDLNESMDNYLFLLIDLNQGGYHFTNLIPVQNLIGTTNYSSHTNSAGTALIQVTRGSSATQISVPWTQLSGSATATIWGVLKIH